MNKLRVVIALLSMIAMGPGTVHGQAAEAAYWRTYAATADSAFSHMCAGLNGLALVMKRHQSGELAQAGYTPEYGIMVAFGIVALSIDQRHGDFEVLAPPSGLELHHQQVGRLFSAMSQSVTDFASRAMWATCRQEEGTGRYCDRLQRSAEFLSEVPTRTAGIIGFHGSYLAARKRLADQLTARGVAVPPFANSACLTVQM